MRNTAELLTLIHKDLDVPNSPAPLFTVDERERLEKVVNDRSVTHYQLLGVESNAQQER